MFSCFFHNWYSGDEMCPECKSNMYPITTTTATTFTASLDEEKKYTEQDMRDCFNNAKLFWGEPIGVGEYRDGDRSELYHYKYRKFEDYLITLPKNNL